MLDSWFRVVIDGNSSWIFNSVVVIPLIQKQELTSKSGLFQCSFRPIRFLVIVVILVTKFEVQIMRPTLVKHFGNCFWSGAMFC